MQPEYKVSVTQQVPTCTDIHFDRLISLRLRKRIKDLAFFEGVTVHESKTEKSGYYIITTPVWGSSAVPEKVLEILLEEGFNKKDILVELAK